MVTLLPPPVMYSRFPDDAAKADVGAKERDRCKGLLLRAAMGGLARLAASKPHAGGNIASQMRTALLKHTTSAIARSSGARKDHF